MRFCSNMVFVCLGLFMCVLQFSCADKSADLVIKNAMIYAVDTTYTADAIAIKGGNIKEIGKWSSISTFVGKNTEVIDAMGHFVMPGFIEGHGHFSGLGYSLINLNFLNAKSWEEIVQTVGERAAATPEGQWIIGRGWHQEKWDSIPKNNIFGYPFHDSLSLVSPNHPVILYHASGHSLFANKKAMELAGITIETANPIGGEIIRKPNREVVGVFEERAMDILNIAYKDYVASLDAATNDTIWYSAIQLAEQECIRKGITSFQDAGSTYDELSKYEKLAVEKKLNLRLWAMVRHTYEDLVGKVQNFKKIDIGNGFFTCNAIKSELDGALGAYGAWMLKPYNDKPGFIGQNTTDVYDVKRIADLALQNDMQMCVHAIGDRANRIVVDIFEGVMKKNPEKIDLRWRIEHAQHIDPSDIPRIKNNAIIASMQGIHCTSDAPFVVRRLGVERSQKGAYAWRSLLDAGIIIANGTDAPVEDVDPIKSFYASVTRKRADNKMEFFPEQKMTREEAIFSYTKGNAFAAKEEKKKGAIRVGYYADLVILSKNLITCTDDEILDTKVLYTIVDGKVKYKS